MKRRWWLIATAALVVIGVGGASAWWFGVAQHRDRAPNATGTAASITTARTVFTGNDLETFLLQQDAVSALVHGVKLHKASYEYDIAHQGGYSPERCSLIQDKGMPELPAGYRSVAGNDTPFSDGGARVSVTQSVYQFPTVAEATDTFVQLADASESCANYKVTPESSSESLPARNRPVTTDAPGSKQRAGIETPVGWEDYVRGWTSLRAGNVISFVSIIGTGTKKDIVTNKLVLALARAASKQATQAAHTTGSVSAATAALPQKTPKENKSMLIDFDSIGPITTAMTAAEAARVLGTSVPTDGIFGSGDPSDTQHSCGSYWFEGNGLAGYLNALADSQGATGPLDSLTIGVKPGPDLVDPTTLPAPLPRTAKGITLGSTLAQVTAAYRDQVHLDDHHYIEGGHYAYITGPGNTAILFKTNASDVVFAITTGRLPEVRYVEGCA